MVAVSTLSGLGALPFLFALVDPARGLSLRVNPDGGNSSSPLLYGFMFEVRIYTQLVYVLSVNEQIGHQLLR